MEHYTALIDCDMSIGLGSYGEKDLEVELDAKVWSDVFESAKISPLSVKCKKRSRTYYLAMSINMQVLEIYCQGA